MNALQQCIAENPEPEVVQEVDHEALLRVRAAKVASYRMGVRLLLWAARVGHAQHWAVVSLRDAMAADLLISDRLTALYFELPDAVAAAYVPSRRTHP